jgi:hypothetical protein
LGEIPSRFESEQGDQFMNKSIIERIKDKIEFGGKNHWLWKGPIYKNGYPYIKYKGKNVLVTRLVLEIWKDIKFGPDKQANHHPDFCEVKHCINPEHLYKGTQLDNMRDYRKPHPGKTKQQKNAEYYARNNQHRKNFGRLS